MLFVGFVGALVVLRGSAFARPDLGPFPAANTVVLATGTLACFVARRAARGHRDGPARAIFALAALLGAAFLALQFREYAPPAARSDALGVIGDAAAVLLAVHGLHVVGGLGLLAWAVSLPPRRGSRERSDLVALYWTFVALAWGALAAWLYGA